MLIRIILIIVGPSGCIHISAGYQGHVRSCTACRPHSTPAPPDVEFSITASQERQPCVNQIINSNVWLLVSMTDTFLLGLNH